MKMKQIIVTGFTDMVVESQIVRFEQFVIRFAAVQKFEIMQLVSVRQRKTMCFGKSEWE